MRSEDRWFGVVLGVVIVAAATWVIVALFNSGDLSSGQAGFLRYALLLGLAGLLGFGAAHFLGGDKGFGIFLAALLGGALIWIVVALFGAELSSGQMTLIRYGALLGLAGVAGSVAGAFLGEDRGVGVFLAAVITGAGIWILVALFSSVSLSAQGRANFGYIVLIGVPAAVGFGLVAWKDSREGAVSD